MIAFGSIGAVVSIVLAGIALGLWGPDPVTQDAGPITPTATGGAPGTELTTTTATTAVADTTTTATSTGSDDSLAPPSSFSAVEGFHDLHEGLGDARIDLSLPEQTLAVRFLASPGAFWEVEFSTDVSRIDYEGGVGIATKDWLIQKASLLGNATVVDIRWIGGELEFEWTLEIMSLDQIDRVGCPFDGHGTRLIVLRDIEEGTTDLLISTATSDEITIHAFGLPPNEGFVGLDSPIVLRTGPVTVEVETEEALWEVQSEGAWLIDC
jgi:hypothetical protein